MKTSRKSLSIAVAVIAALALPATSAVADGASAFVSPRPVQNPAASQGVVVQQGESPAFIGFVAATPEGKLLASNVPVAAPTGGQPRMMVLRTDGTPVSPEESNVRVVRNPDGTLTVQRTDEGDAGVATEPPPTGEHVMVVPAGQAAADTPPAAGQGDATVPPAAGQGDATALPAAGQGDATAPPAAGQGEQTFVVGGAGASGEGAPAMNWVSDEGGEAAAPASDEALQFTEFVIDESTEVIGTMVPGMPVLVAFEEVDGVKIARRIEVLGG